MDGHDGEYRGAAIMLRHGAANIHEFHSVPITRQARATNTFVRLKWMFTPAYKLKALQYIHNIFTDLYAME